MPITPADIPLRRQDHLFHAGHLDPAGRRGESHEGDCLSASLHPEEWTRIARLGGASVLRLERAQAQFIDALALSPDLEARILAEAVEAGILQETILWNASWWDEELDDEIVMAFTDESEAEDQVEDMEEACITEVTGHVLTPDGQRAFGGRLSADPAHARDAAILWLARHLGEQDADLCGVFWNETLDPDRFSAPRYAILPEKLDGFRVDGPEGRMPFGDYVRTVAGDLTP